MDGCMCTDLLPVSWTVLSWKIPFRIVGPVDREAMKRSKFSEAQIAFILVALTLIPRLRHHRRGGPIVDIYLRH